jgi:hypothetical protein
MDTSLYRRSFNEGRSLEIIYPTVYDKDDNDQWAIDYGDDLTHLAIVGGGGEVRGGSDTYTTGNLRMEIWPYAHHEECAGNKVVPVEVYLHTGELLRITISLQKNKSMPQGRRPKIHLRGQGIDTYVEMSDAIDEWESLVITGTAQSTGIVNFWVTGGINEWDPAEGENYYTPYPVGYTKVYVDGINIEVD